MVGVAPLQVQAGRLTSKPFSTMVRQFSDVDTAEERSSTTLRAAHTCRCAEEIAVRHQSSCRGRVRVGEGVPSHRAPVGPAIPGHIISVAGQSVPRGVSLRCSVLLLLSHDDSAATSPIHGPSATPAKGTSRTTATPATPAVFGAAVARHRHHVWSHSYPVAPRTPPSLRHTTLEIPSADFPITSPPARSKRATIAKQMLAY